MRELVILEDVVESLKEKYQLMQIQNHPVAYKLPLKTDPIFTYDADSFKVAYQRGPTLTARENIQGITLLVLTNDLPALTRSSCKHPYLEELAKQVMRTPCDALESNVSAMNAYTLFCEFVDYHAASKA